MNKSELVELRNAVSDDFNFIMATWLRGLYYGESWYSEIKKQVFMTSYHKVLESILKNPATRIKVACLKEDPSVILGYSVYSTSPGVLHWVFVKKAWRKVGIANDLMPNPLSVVTHLTKTGLSLIKKKNLEFNPFAM